MGALDTVFWRLGPSPRSAPSVGVTLDPVSSLLDLSFPICNMGQCRIPGI